MIIKIVKFNFFKYILLNVILYGTFFIENICLPYLMNNIDYVKNNNINNKNSPSICRYCLCDLPSVSVICNSKSKMHLKIINLPSWAEIFYAYNLTLTNLPHFSYHLKLRILRINYCKLSNLHSLTLLSLPALEIIDFRNNKISLLPQNFFKRLKHLKVINLAQNQIHDLSLIKWSLSNNKIIDELHLSGNTLCQSVNNNFKFTLPKTRRLYLINANIKSINSTHITFKVKFIYLKHLKTLILFININYA